MNTTPWHRIKLTSLQPRLLSKKRPWRWQTAMDNGRKRIGLIGATGRFYWFKLNHGGSFIQHHKLKPASNAQSET